MPTNLPELKIPVTVQTDGVDRGLSAVERKLRNSAAKMKRLGGSAAGAAAGAPGFGLKAQQGTALLGGVGKLGPAAGLLGGMGGAGLALAAPLAAFGIAAQQVQTLAQMTKGASEALALFKETGEQTFTANSALLERLASLESQAQISAAGPGYGEAFSLGMARVGEQSVFDILNEFGKQATAFVGAMIGGKSVEQASLEAALITASEAQGKAIAEQIKAIEDARSMGQGTSGVADIFFSTVYTRLDQIAVMLGKL